MIKCIILFHGYGANGDDLLNFGNELAKEFTYKIDIFAPNAPFICEYGQNSFKWFDIDVIDPEYFQDGLNLVRPIVLTFLERILIEKQLNSSEVLICGFSQGASVAIDIGLKYEKKFGGILSLSGGIADTIQSLKDHLKSKPKICLLHGKKDNILPHFYSLRTKAILDKFEIENELHLFENLGHMISKDYLDYSINFIKKINEKTN
jgi:phospholipase/carboxylesterase